MTAKALFDVPSGAVAHVSIVDSTLRLSRMNPTYLMHPPVPGFDQMPTLPSWSFLIQSSNGEKVLFDIGVPRNRKRGFSPAIQKKLDESGWEIKVEKDIVDVLAEHGVEPKDIDSVIWSHWHWDHIGDMSLFPPETDLIVGPGFKDAFLPAYPTNPDSPLLESYFSGRNLREITFQGSEKSLKAGKLRAHDFFGDGSFFLLDTPGHAVGHLAGLARTTTSPDTFIFMGGDLCHHGAEIRPSAFLPYPASISIPPLEAMRSTLSVCPGSDHFEALHRKLGRSVDEPIFSPVLGLDLPLAIKTIQETQEADARDDIFFIYAHDPTLHGVVDLFPLPANSWKEKGWKNKTLWTFLADLIPATQVK